MSLLQDGYARRALIEALLVGALCGLVGVHVVLRRLSFFTMAMKSDSATPFWLHI